MPSLLNVLLAPVIPATLTQYKKPLPYLHISLILSVEVVGAMRYISLISFEEHLSNKIKDSSNGKSGTIIPSTPQDFALVTNSSSPYCKIGL